MSYLLPFAILLCSAQAPVPVILDTDLGDDIDDTWALAMMVGFPGIDLKLITTASDNTPVKSLLAAKILKALHRQDIPIGTGKQTSDNPINQAAWLGDFTLDGYAGTIHKDGVQALIDTIHASPVPVTLCVIGPHTNIAAALERDPGIAEKARIVSMAGSINIGYLGNPEPQPEWNVHRDLEAIQKVWAAPWEITIAPLDVCGLLILSGDRYQRVAQSESMASKAVIENYRQWSNFSNYPPGESSVLFDTVAVYLCHSTDWVELETLPIKIDAEGRTVVSPEEGRPVHCALRWKDREAFEDHLVESLNRQVLRFPPPPPSAE